MAFSLPTGRGDEGQDPVGLAEVESRQDDGLGGVPARDGHGQPTVARSSVAPGDRRVPDRRRRCGRVPRAGVTRASGRRSTGYLQRTRFVYTRARDDRALPISTSPQLIADTEGEIVRLVEDRDPSTHGLYEMVRYHLALDGSGANGGKRMRPLLGLLAYASIAGDHQRALPGAAAVELGHNFSLVHDDIEDGDLERRHRPTLWTVHGVPQAINAGDTLFSLSRIALHRLTDLGFSDAKVLRLMRLYDETCLALCEGQYLDIAASESDELMSVDGYFDMIGRKTAALIAASIEAGALLATDDDEVIARYRGVRLGARASPSSSTTTCSASGARRTRPARPRPTSPTARRRCRSSTPPSTRVRRTAPGWRALTRCPRRPRRGRRDRGHPGADRRPRLHPRPGPPLPRRGARELDAAGVVGPPPGPASRRSSSGSSRPEVSLPIAGDPEPADGEPERVAAPVAVRVGHHRARGRGTRRARDRRGSPRPTSRSPSA